MTQVTISKVVVVEPPSLSLTPSAPDGAVQPPSELRSRGPLPLTAEIKMTLLKEPKEQ